MKILVFTKQFLGDIVFEAPALEALKRGHPGARIVCAAPERFAELLHANPSVDAVLPLDRRAAPAARLRFVRELRRERLDRAFLFHRSFVMALLALCGGARERIGHVTTARRLLLTHPVPKPDTARHDVYAALGLVEAAGVTVTVEPRYACYYPAEAPHRIEALLQDRRLDPTRLVALNPGATQAWKRWPPERFARLADALADRYGCALAVTGDEADAALACEIGAATSRAVPVSLCGATSLGELAALYARCRLVVSGDTGPLHVAAGVGTPVVALYGPTDPARKGPLGRGPSLVIRAEAQEGRAMSSITPERVLRAIDEARFL